MAAPLNLKQLLAKSATADITLDDSTIEIEYYPHKYNLNVHMRMTSSEDGDFDPLIDILCSLLYKWNLQDDDGNMVPITVENLKELIPVPVVLGMVRAIVESVNPKGN